MYKQYRNYMTAGSSALALEGEQFAHQASIVAFPSNAVPAARESRRTRYASCAERDRTLELYADVAKDKLLCRLSGVLAVVALVAGIIF